MLIDYEHIRTIVDVLGAIVGWEAAQHFWKRKNVKQPYREPGVISQQCTIDPGAGGEALNALLVHHKMLTALKLIAGTSTVHYSAEHMQHIARSTLKDLGESWNDARRSERVGHVDASALVHVHHAGHDH